ncbi:MAG TPA: YbhB/YbcL family Raf kinase inhibitor-like protein [Allosphingosinicella sp.]|jgi:Raf kinase inhibitor-like YbhB/YbcL family protein
MKPMLPAAALLLLLACSNAGEAGAANPALAADRPETKTSATLALSSPAFGSGGPIPLAFSAYGQGSSPALSWSALPPGTRSLALMVEDPDAVSARPFVHWLAWNIAAGSRGLAQGSVPAGVVQGRNGRGGAGWFGPHPPAGAAHHYHFQLFALDTALALPAGADREQLLAAMKGHVLAKGDLVGLFKKP